MAPKPYAGATVELGGETRTLRLTFGAIVEIRDEVGIDLLRGGQGEVDPYRLPQILAALLRHEDREVSADDIAHMLDMSNIPAVMEAALQALSADMPQSQGAATGAAPLARGRKTRQKTRS